MRLKEKIPNNKSLIDLAKKVDLMLRSKNSKSAFKLIKNITILHPSKRDGGIMNCFLDENDNVIVDSNTVLRRCMDTLGKYSMKIVAPNISETYFPSLQPLN